MAMLLREHPVEQETETGAAFFEPNTALLLQDPLNYVTYDLGKTLSRSIGSLKLGGTVLAEKYGPDGRGNFSLAKITCVMTFEIPQDEDPVANKIIQETFYRQYWGLHSLNTTTFENMARFTEMRGAGGSLPTQQETWNGRLPQI